MRLWPKIIIFGGILILLGTDIFFVYKISATRSVGKKSEESSAYSTDTLLTSSLESCRSKADSCYVKELEKVTTSYGPKASLALLKSFQKQGVVSAKQDDHQLAHSIGRFTAKKFGITGESFLRCDTSFNYGCQHGFFEYALGVVGSAKDTAEKICGSFQGTYSSKFIFYCYHGVGHGILMAKAYDVPSALETCDSLRTSAGKEGCWQGVFMENANAGMRGEARSGQFSKENPLLPCSQVADIYKYQCFINHAGWLVTVFPYDMAAASAACLDAPSEYINACMQSLGLMVSNPSWQYSLTTNTEGIALEAIAWKLCLQFPEKYRDQCVIGAVDNLLNFHELDLSSPKTFCNKISSVYTLICYNQIGSSLRSQVLKDDKIREACFSMKEDKINTQSCFNGAGLQS